MKNLKSISAVLLAGALIFTSCTKEEEKKENNTSTGDYDSSKNGSLMLNFDSMAGEDDLIMGDTLTNSLGEKFTVNRFQYYVSNIKLTAEDGSIYEVPTTSNSGYYFIKEGVNENVMLNVPENNYTHVEFMVGVDSLRNTMAPEEREGVLDIGDQETGGQMYWSWNSGYIFMRFEGTTNAIPDSIGSDDFVIHVGGFGGYDNPMPNNTRMVKITSHDGDMMKVREDDDVMGHIMVDVMKIMDASNTYSFSENYSVHSPMKSGKFADNYVNMFMLHHVH